MSKGEQHERNKKKEKRGFVSYLAGAGRDAGDEAARRELLVEEAVSYTHLTLPTILLV